MPRSKTFAVTREQFENLSAQARQEGFNIVGDKGEAGKLGVLIGYEYDGAVLTLTIKQRPFILSEKRIWSGLEQHLPK